MFYKKLVLIISGLFFLSFTTSFAFAQSEECSSMLDCGFNNQEVGEYQYLPCDDTGQCANLACESVTDDFHFQCDDDDHPWANGAVCSKGEYKGDGSSGVCVFKDDWDSIYDKLLDDMDKTDDTTKSPIIIDGNDALPTTESYENDQDSYSGSLKPNVSPILVEKNNEDNNQNDTLILFIFFLSVFGVISIIVLGAVIFIMQKKNNQQVVNNLEN